MGQKTRVTMCAVVAVVAMAGCSFALQQQRGPALVDGKCSTSKTLPWVDAGISVAGASAGLVGMGLHDAVGPLPRHESAGTAVSMIGFATAMAFLISSKNGFDEANACRQRATLASR